MHTSQVCSTTSAEAKEEASTIAKAHARENTKRFMLQDRVLMLVVGYGIKDDGESYIYREP